MPADKTHVTRPAGVVDAAQKAVRRFFAEDVAERRLRDRLVMARSLGALYLAGAIIALVSLLLPHRGGADTANIAAICGIALGIGFILLGERGRLPAWAFPAACYAATILISFAVYYSDRADSPYSFFYVLIGMFAAYFLTAIQLLLQVVALAIAYPVAIHAVGGGSQSADRWLLTVWTVIVVGAFIAILSHRMSGLIGRLSDAARRDPLTGLLNRRGFKDVFDLELERSRRSGRPCALLIGDLDHFKRVNDLLGHPAGDERLKRFGNLLDTGKRRIDAVARMGGEEFALLLPETDEHGGYVIAERLRHKVRDAFSTDQVALTVSFGVAAYPNHGGSGDQLLQAADQALYVAKELGRDRTALFRAEVTARVMASKEQADLRAEGYLSAMLVLAEAVDIRDAGSPLHSETVGRYAELIAAELGLEAEHVERVKLAGILHDIGKVGVPDAILQKAGPLDDSDWEELHKHCELGSRLLSGAGLDDIGAWVLCHHERVDGTGYPDRLDAEEIPLEARILAVADAYEAMIADRPYRPGMSPAAAREELERCSGTQFDTGVLQAFLAALDEGEPAGAGLLTSLVTA
jgi:diguanylate cyclase (GGDEF)-like protein